GGFGDHIVAAHHQGNGLFLNLGHLGKTHGLGGADDLGRNVGKLGELHSVCTAFRNILRFLFIITGFVVPCKTKPPSRNAGAARGGFICFCWPDGQICRWTSCRSGYGWPWLPCRPWPGP